MSGTRPRIKLALGEYDRSRALLDGRVRVEGFDIELIPMSDAFKRHDLMLRHQAFDVCELSMSSYLMARQRGQVLHALPVFPYRMFRHGYILVNRHSGIEDPRDLIGKRVGTHMYQTTTALWVRGHLLHEYGVAPDQFAWFTEMPELIGFKPPPGVSITEVPLGSLETRLESGDLDALILIEEVPVWLLDSPSVRRLFPNFVEVEREFYQRTRIYPMMHALVAQEALLREHPSLARSVREAFDQAKQVALEELRYPRTSTLVWAGGYREQEIELFGEDPYAFGIAANRPTLEALVSYSHEQGLTHRLFTLDELFEPDAPA